MELLVVVSVMALLLALLLPALQAAREAARRVRCAHNLRQIGLAIHSYEGTQGCLPPGRRLTHDPRFAGPNPPCTSRVVDQSFLIRLLPYLEQRAIYDAINQDLAILGFENRTINRSVIGEFACPSDSGAGAPRAMWTENLVSEGLARPDESLLMSFTSYSGCFGSYPVDALPQPGSRCLVPARVMSQANGCFNDTAAIQLASIRDGLGQTIFVSEKATARFQRLIGIDPGLYSERGWYTTGNWGDTLFTTFFPPNMPGRVAIAAGSDHTRAASSLHPGGFQLLMGDGSVRFATETIQSWPFDPVTGRPPGAVLVSGGWWENVPKPGIWQALGTCSGDELITEFP